MQDFKAIPVKFSEKSKACHYLYVKPHNVREKVSEKPPDLTLFVVGVPPYYNEECLKELFSIFGAVNNVYLHKTPTAQIPPKEISKFFPKIEPIKGFKIAYVVFKKGKFLRNALECDEPLIFSNNLVLFGIQKWNQQYNSRFPDLNEMELDIKTFMDKFDEEASKKIQAEKSLSEPQDDGWVTVTKRGRKPGFARKESVANQLKKRGEQQRKKRELSAFYTFQIKESKMKNLVTLRKKFEEDKKRIAALREARRFKPF